MEIDKRLKDKNWRVEHLYKIVNKDKQLVIYKRNDIQKLFVKDHWYRNIICKSRQLGLTTEACIDGLDDVLFNNDFTMVIIAHELEAVKKIFKRIKKAWDNFDPELKELMGWKANQNNANELSFNNGSSISVALSSRSDTVNRLHVSEFGKICKKYPQKAEEIITGAFPSVPENGRIDIESTAEGEYGAFHDMFWEAIERGDPQANKQFKAFFFPWVDDRQYTLKGVFDIPQELLDYAIRYNLSKEQINWYFIEKQTQKDKMQQEYPTTKEEAFISSGNKLFDAEMILKQVLQTGRKINDWIYYDTYKPNHRYAIGADVAEGVGQDSSTAVVIDFSYSTPRVVAEYASNKIAPDTFGYELYKTGMIFGGCIIAPERNNHGFTTITKLRDLGYRNIYYVKKEEQTNNKTMGRPILAKRFTIKYGWHTNGATKPLMMYDLNEAINDELIDIPSKYINEELRTYDKEDLTVLRFDENQTRHWDRIIALAICWQMKDKLTQPEPQRKQVHALNNHNMS